MNRGSLRDPVSFLFSSSHTALNWGTFDFPQGRTHLRNEGKDGVLLKIVPFLKCDLKLGRGAGRGGTCFYCTGLARCRKTVSQDKTKAICAAEECTFSAVFLPVLLSPSLSWPTLDFFLPEGEQNHFVPSLQLGQTLFSQRGRKNCADYASE